MSSLSQKDRASLCSFTFSDGRRCRTPRLRDNPRFCPYHAQKEARARAAQSLGKDLAYFFSGDYLSACDLSTALGRLIPAVIRGDVKPRTARTVAYVAQTLMQAIHLSKHEYINAFGTDSWRQSIRNSVKGNHDYLFPPAPAPAQPAPAPQQSASSQPQPQHVQTPVNSHSACLNAVGERSAPSAVRTGLRTEESASSSNSPLATHHSPLPHAPASSPQAPLPPTSAEFAQHVMADRPRSLRPGSTGETGGSQAPQPAPTPANCHPDPVAQASRPEEPACPAAPAAQPNNPPPTTPTAPPSVRNLDASAYHYDHTYRLLIDGKPV